MMVERLGIIAKESNRDGWKQMAGTGHSAIELIILLKKYVAPSNKTSSG